LELFREIDPEDVSDARQWAKVGLALYDGAHHAQALVAFERATEHADDGGLWAFTSLVWQGQLLDLLGRRDEALARYGAALKLDEQHGPHRMQHSQYGMLINRAWVERRLEEPFDRR
ncbi:MAG: hypothetical protein ACYTGG_13730, partial [Planctomycetota bacterium]|jgi:tetratricopeptide (TPR) repeat protein